MLLWKVLRHLKTSKPWPYLLCMHPLACSALPNCKSNVCPFKAYNRIKRFNNQPNRRWRWVPLTHEHSSWFYHPFSLSFVPALLPWRKKCLILETGRGWRHSTALTYSSPPSSPLLSSYAPLKDLWRIAPCRSNLRYLSVHKAADPRGFYLDGAAMSPRLSWVCPSPLIPQSEEGSSGLEVLSLCRLYGLSWSPTYIKQLLVPILNEFSFFRVCPHIPVYRRDKKCMIQTVRGALLAFKFN